MKRTPLFEKHVALGARIVPFAGFEMPVQYPGGIVQEHLAVRNAVGLFDVSHMGEFRIRGSDATAFLQRVTINDVSRLDPGRVQYTAMCYEDGGMIDDLLLYHLGDSYMMVVNAANAEKDLLWIRDHANGDVEIEDESEETILLAVQGPKALETLSTISATGLSDLAYYAWTQTKIAGVPVLVSRTGYTGEIGFELYIRGNADIGVKVWDAIVDAGKDFGIAPVGLGARDTLRLEMGFCLYGNDIDLTTNPLEAGLGWITKLEKGGFIGREAIVAARSAGLQKLLVGFVGEGKSVPRHGYGIFSGGVRIGHVTSGTFSPVLQQPIGMGYVHPDRARVGEKIFVDIRGKMVGATIVKPPFVKK
ncbi:MAG: glycine cleavage system aminomethyltransferase GcvT [Ignavibacteria bacterium]|nr:glycine cleavage system aminomethyltransferase GcvT [Ignavibacteria bacterium]